MPLPDLIPDAMLTRFRISDPTLIAETAIARIFKVRRRQGGVAALKHYWRGHMGNETAGRAVLEAWDGHGAVRVFDHDQAALLMEWLEGPSLGDLSRQGRDACAATELLSVACHLHRSPVTTSQPLPRLHAWFEGLLGLSFSADCAPQLRHDMQRAMRVATELMAKAVDMHPLHGDLHHDNIRASARGYVAFDAKGLFGDRAYELANAFRHPADQPDLVRDPRRILSLAEQWAGGFDVPRERLLGWAAAKCALSIAWRNGTVLRADPEADLLAVLLECSGAP